MPRKAEGVSSLSGPMAADAQMIKHRTYNRDYMRRWRSDPLHRARERARSHLRSREGAAHAAVRSSGPPYINSRGELVCGFCLRRAAVEQVTRLRISESAPEKYVRVRMPYCGEC